MRLLLLTSLSLASIAWAQVPWAAETPSVPSHFAGGVAITSLAAGRVVGTDTHVGGSFVYELTGVLSAPLITGPAEGVASRLLVVDGVARHLTAIAAPTDGVRLYEGVGLSLSPVGTVPRVAVSQTALARGPDGGPLLLTYDQGTTLQTWALSDDGGQLSGTRGADLALGAALRGMVVDDRRGVVYVSLGAQGLARVDLTTGALEPLDVDGGAAAAGLAFYPLPDGGGLLLAAEPTNDDVAVYAASAGGLELVTLFTVEDGGRKVLGGQWLDVTQEPLPGFPAGLLVLQDPDVSSGGHYKLVAWDTLAAATTPALPVVTGPTDGGPGPDGGLDGGPDGGSSSYHPGIPPIPSDEPPKRPCGCGAAGPLLLPLALWLVLRRRRAS